MSPYQPDGNAINERIHQTINNIVRARLQRDTTTRSWVDKILGIMLKLNSMSHKPHRYLASMIATGWKNLLPPDLITGASPSASVDTVPSYLNIIRRRLQYTQKWLTLSEAPIGFQQHRGGRGPLECHKYQMSIR